MLSLGLIAGDGRFPMVVADSARASGLRVVAVAIRGCASRELAGHVDRFYWAGVAQLGRNIRCLKREGVANAIMAGSVPHRRMFAPLKLVRYRPDWRMLRFWYRRLHGDRRADSIHSAFADELASEGIEVENSLERVPHLTVEPGCLTRRRPTDREWQDIKLGWDLAKAMGGLDVGQTVVVKEGAALAVEAIEGTDEAIRRGATLGHGEVVVVKVAKPNQDLRFDIPTVGPGTIQAMAEAGARVLAIEAGRTLVLDQGALVEAADRADLAIVAVTAATLPK
jgi:DUF1009 family protein